MRSVGVVLLNYGTPEDILSMVQQLKLQTSIKIEVVVVDNCSPDNSWQIFNREYERDPVVDLVLSTKNNGYASGNNLGISHFIQKGGVDFIAVLNSDISIPDHRLLSRLTKQYIELEDQVGFISPSMIENGQVSRNACWRIPGYWDDVFDSTRITRQLSRNLSYDLSGPEDLIPVECLPGSFFMASLERFIQIGLLDEGTFLYAEERILARQVKNQGLCNYLAKNLTYHHGVSGSISKSLSLWKTRRELIRSRSYYHRFYNKKTALHSLFLRLLTYPWLIETILVQGLKRVLPSNASRE